MMLATGNTASKEKLMTEHPVKHHNAGIFGPSKMSQNAVIVTLRLSVDGLSFSSEPPTC